MGIFSAILDKFEGTYQVEMLGDYSPIQTKYLYSYINGQTNVLKSIWTCIWTPLPPLFLVILLNQIPLQDSKLGPDPNFLLAHHLEVMFAVMIIVSQLHWIIPEFKIGFRKGLWIILCYTISHFIMFMFIVQTFMIFPIPFMIQLGSAVGLPVTIFWIYFFIKNPFVKSWQTYNDTKDAKARIINLAKTIITQTVIILVYALFGTVFFFFQGNAQTALTLMLPMFKIGFKYLTTIFTEEFAQDVAPITSVFTSELFNAIYVSICLQQSKGSYLTIGMIICIDIGQNYFYVRKFQRLSTGVDELPATMQPTGRKARTHSIPNQSKISPSEKYVLSDGGELSAVKIKSGKTLTKDEMLRHFLHTSEHLALTEYVEIITPIIYSKFYSSIH